MLPWQRVRPCAPDLQPPANVMQYLSPDPKTPVGRLDFWNGGKVIAHEKSIVGVTASRKYDSGVS